VTATGTLQPTNQVDVGSELSGIVKSVEADFNDRVKVGQVLARLDTTRLEAQVLQAEAAVRAAEARVRGPSERNEMRRKLARAQELSSQSTSPRSAGHRPGRRRSRRGHAPERAQPGRPGRATLTVDRTNLAKSVIRSPINGTVLARKVEPGQTVAATLRRRCCSRWPRTSRNGAASTSTRPTSAW
jgi:HlyD family secretion protein